MTRTALLVATMLLMTSARAAHATITLTINPEARLSAIFTGAAPAAIPCGRAITIPVLIINAGFVTAPLDATLVDADDTLSLDFATDPLTGASREERALHLTIRKAGLVDVTLAFSLHHDVPDPGGRDRIHFLMWCFT